MKAILGTMASTLRKSNFLPSLNFIGMEFVRKIKLNFDFVNEGIVGIATLGIALTMNCLHL